MGNRNLKINFFSIIQKYMTLHFDNKYTQTCSGRLFGICGIDRPDLIISEDKTSGKTGAGCSTLE